MRSLVRENSLLLDWIPHSSVFRIFDVLQALMHHSNTRNPLTHFLRTWTLIFTKKFTPYSPSYSAPLPPPMSSLNVFPPPHTNIQDIATSLNFNVLPPCPVDEDPPLKATTWYVEEEYKEIDLNVEKGRRWEYAAISIDIKTISSLPCKTE